MQRLFRPLPLSGCRRSAPTRRNSVWNRHGLHGKTWISVRSVLPARNASLNKRVDDPNLPPIPTRLALVKLFLELALFAPALLVLHGVMASDDQDVEAWYLEGWCFFLMSEQAQEKGGKLDDITWQELATDARDCLATCQVVRYFVHLCALYSFVSSCT